jgi:hypothetical protein
MLSAVTLAVLKEVLCETTQSKMEICCLKCVYSMLPCCTKSKLLCETDQVKVVRLERVARKEKSECACH